MLFAMAEKHAFHVDDAAPRRASYWLTILTTIVTAGALGGVLGRAFYVGRTEYTTAETINAVAHTKITETLDRVDRSMASQARTLEKMVEALHAQAVEMAALRIRPTH
jgi:hypothetical protein